MAVNVSSSSQTENIAPRNGVVVLSGFGITVSVERGALVVEDGIGSQRCKGQFYKATSAINRLVVIGHAGIISLDALRWLHDIGAAFVQIDADSNVIAATSPRGLNDARLRRAQALAVSNQNGVRIVRDLLRAKFTSQRKVLEGLPDTHALQLEIRRQYEDLDANSDPRSFLMIEARAASAYWAGWKGVEMRFARRDLAKVPEHWQHFDTRRSPISNASRLASTPMNAMLNYLYAILETEVRIAILTIGLDPGMAMLHSDLKARDSFVFDVIEPLRPVVDSYVLSLLEKRVFSIRDFHETRRGVVRIMPPLATTFAEFGPELAKITKPLVEQIAQALADTTTNGFRVPTLLTEANRSKGRDGIRSTPKSEIEPNAIPVSMACRNCGVILESTDRKYCDACLPERFQEHIDTFTTKGRARLQALRAQGMDPSTSDEANQKRREIMKKRRQAEIEWDARHPDVEIDEEWFKSRIVPALQGLPLRQISAATGLSQQYCSLVRRGKKLPHVRHWKNFATLLESPKPR